MNWAINIPFCDRDDLVLDAISAARQTLPGDEAQVVEVIATDALQRSITTVGGLLDEESSERCEGSGRQASSPSMSSPT